MMMDIDHFKQFNDNYGHDIGDEILKLTSKTFTTSVRETDIIGRYGGEEFIIIVPETDLKEVKLVAERVRANVEKQTLYTDKFGELKCTLSIGISTIIGTEENLEEMVKRADNMLYKAKESGRNRVVSEKD